MNQYAYKLALVGNPNSGKTSVFNQLTGLRQKTGNFPGVTVDKKTGKLEFPGGLEATLVDLPGTYSLYPNSQDERIVLETLINHRNPLYPDGIIYVADQLDLERHLLLFSQILDLGFPCLLVLNRADEAARQQITLNLEVLSKELGVPVVSHSGRDAAHGKQLKERIGQFIQDLPNMQERPGFCPLDPEERKIAEWVQARMEIKNPYRALLWIHHFKHLSYLDPEEQSNLEKISARHGFASVNHQVEETLRRFSKISPLVHKTVVDPVHQPDRMTRGADRVLTHPFFGPLIFLSTMFLVFQSIFSWAALPMEWIDHLFGEISLSLKTSLPNTWYANLLTEGILPGIGGILVFVPQIAILFFLISLLEECGYMARAVYLFDNLMRFFGLNGKSIVSLISGGACAIPAIMSTRTIGNWKERLVTILVTPLISCSARIPVYTVLIAFVVPPVLVWNFLNAQGLVFMGLYLTGIIVAMFTALILSKLLKTREVSMLAIEMPPYRRPAISNVLLTVWSKVSTFVQEAGKIILIISIVLWVIASYGPGSSMQDNERAARLVAEQKNLSPQETEDLVAAYRLESSYAGVAGRWLEPLIKPLGYDWKIGIALITSFAAREVFVGTMATIYSLGSRENDVITLHQRMAQELNPDTGKARYDLATALSLLLFYAFSMQCMSTIAVVRRETASWKWPLLQFFLLGGLAYLSSFAVYQWLS